MDQLCVICKSATYHEHDALTASLRKQFWQMIPMSLFVWGDWESQEQEENVSLLACVRIQGEVMKTIIFHEHTIQYNPSNRYIVTFLKAYIDLVECAPNYSLDDELMEFYVSLVTTTDTSAAPHAMCFKTYTLDKEQYTRIVLKEEQLPATHGAAGLQMWEAGLRLADFFVENPDIVRDKSVVELGAGFGLAGFVCAAMGASHVSSTDHSKMTVKLLEENRQINAGIADKVRVSELSWADTDECSRLSAEADIVIGTDIVDDPTVVPTLVQALKVMVRSSQQVVYITVTIRDPETFDMFLAQIDNSEVLGRSVMDLTETQMTTLCHPNPTADIRLVLITRK